MDINKDTTVKLVGPFESSIKLEALVKILNEFLGKEYDLDELGDSYYFYSPTCNEVPLIGQLTLSDIRKIPQF